MFVQSGGRLITFDAASDLPLESFGGVFAHIRNTVSPLARTTFYCPGSVLRLDVDVAHPAASGMTPRPAAYFAGSRGFETDDPTVVSIARYAAKAEDVLMSGWLLGAEHLAGRHAVLQVPLGQGSVLLFALPPAVPRATARDLQAGMFNGRCMPCRCRWGA